jgi:peptidoglycan/xylan/chitin deacetylase (PgdA/CDA1 family)
MAAAGVEIGSHTRTHVDLGAPMDDAELCDELASSKWELEEEISTEIRYFAFPFGFADNMTSDAFRIALESGYQGVCSAYGAYNFAGDDPFHIRRIHGDPEMIRLKNWLTVDPRKLHCRLAFDPGDYRTPRLAPGSAAG